MKLSGLLLGALTLTGSSMAMAATLTVEVNQITANGVGASLGTVTMRDTKQGLLVEPKLSGLPPGPHGFHVHENPNCGPGMSNGQMAAGFAAGGHFDPMHTGKHSGPHEKNGHLGDLPVLVVDKDGTATLPVLAERLKAKDVPGHALMVHAGGDNYADEPAPLGGGGPRIACGAIKGAAKSAMAGMKHMQGMKKKM